MSQANRPRKRVSYACTASLASIAVAGCATGARVQFTTAQSLDALNVEVAKAVREYHAEIRAADTERRHAAVDAFAARIRASRDDGDATTQHVGQFNQALDQLQTDAEAENERLNATLDNLSLVTEAAAGLRRIAVESMTLNDEVRRYLTVRLSPPSASNELEGE